LSSGSISFWKSAYARLSSSALGGGAGGLSGAAGAGTENTPAAGADFTVETCPAGSGPLTAGLAFGGCAVGAGVAETATTGFAGAWLTGAAFDCAAGAGVGVWAEGFGVETGPGAAAVGASAACARAVAAIGRKPAAASKIRNWDRWATGRVTEWITLPAHGR
jgi:hypothetical protein